MRVWNDDGSYADFDGSGNIVGGGDPAGNLTAFSGSVAQQVMDLVSLGARSMIYSKYGTAAQQAAGVAPTPAQMQQSQLMSLLLIGGLGFIAYKALT